MRFRRKSGADEVEPVEEVDETPDEVAAPVEQEAAREGRPRDVEELETLEGWVDLGALLIAPQPGRELQLQVDERTHQVQSVLLAGQDGAMELRPFAAPRSGDLWSEVRPQIAADIARQGGTADEREGPFGTELVCRTTVRADDGRTGQQVSRVLGVNGSRWLLRVTLLGRPAVEPDQAGEWDTALAGVAVRRGEQAMPPGDALPLVLPEDARRSGPLP